MSVFRCLLVLSVLPLAACETDPLTELESSLIYSRMVGQVSRELTAAAAGDVDINVECPIGGTYSITGTVAGSSVDRGWDVTTQASSCGIGGESADGESARMSIGGLAEVFMPQPDDETPFSVSGSVVYERIDGGGFGSGNCTLYAPRAEGESGGCEESL